MNRHFPLIMGVIVVAYILAHDTAITGSMHGAPIAAGAVAVMHSTHATDAIHRFPHQRTNPGCDAAPAIVNDACVSTPTANRPRPDGDRDAAPFADCAIMRGRDSQLAWPETGNIHSFARNVRQALLQVFLN